jgi:hypothetical protein
VQTHSRATTVAGHTVGVMVQALLIGAIITLAALALSPVLRPAASIAGVQTSYASTTSWIALRSATSAAATQPSLGSTVAFDAGYPKTVKTPRYAVKCFQDGVLVYAEARNVDESLLLGGGSSTWLTSGGSATCTADLFYFTYKGKVQTYHWLASTDFAAAG